MVVCPKDPLLDLEEKCVIVYECKCELCGQLYVGEMERSLGENAQEHDKSVKEGDSKSAIRQHQVKTGHLTMNPRTHSGT